MAKTFAFDRSKTERDFKKLVIDYLRGKKLTEIDDRLIKICSSGEEQRINGKELCKMISVIDKDDTFDEEIREILDDLGAQPQYNGNDSLYHLLTQLRNEGHEHVDFLIELIDRRQVPGNWKEYIIPPAFTLLGGLGICYFEPQFFWSTLDWIIEILPIVYHWLYYHIIQLHYLPLFGMGGQALLGGYYSWHTFEYGFEQSDKRIRRWVFNTIAILLNLLGHLISYWAAGALPLLPAILFITASFIYVFESIYAYWQQTPPVNRPPPTDENIFNVDIHDQQELQPRQKALRDSANALRQKFFVDRDRQLSLIRSIYALLVSLLVIASYLLPGSVILTIVYTLSLWLAQLIKENLLDRETRNTAVALQKALTENYEKDVSPLVKFTIYKKTLNEVLKEASLEKKNYFDKLSDKLQEKLKNGTITLQKALTQYEIEFNAFDSIKKASDINYSLNNSIIS